MWVKSLFICKYFIMGFFYYYYFFSVFESKSTMGHQLLSFTYEYPEFTFNLQLFQGPRTAWQHLRPGVKWECMDSSRLSAEMCDGSTLFCKNWKPFFCKICVHFRVSGGNCISCEATWKHKYNSHVFCFISKVCILKMVSCQLLFTHCGFGN